MNHVDYRYFAWWTDAEGRLWFRHECADGKIDEWRAPPPWRVVLDHGRERVEPSLDCKTCGRHVVLIGFDRIEDPLGSAGRPEPEPGE